MRGLGWDEEDHHPAERRKTMIQQQKPGSWMGSSFLPPLPTLLSCSWSLEAPSSVGFFLFPPFSFLSNDLGKSELWWELSHCEWERDGSCTNLGLSGRLRKQKTTSMFHNSPNYNGVKFGTSAVKTSLQISPGWNPPARAMGRRTRNPICCSRLCTVRPCN